MVKFASNEMKRKLKIKPTFILLKKNQRVFFSEKSMRIGDLSR